MYAIKIGEVYLRQQEPITEEQRREAVRLLLKNSRLFPTPAGEVTACVPGGLQHAE